MRLLTIFLFAVLSLHDYSLHFSFRRWNTFTFALLRILVLIFFYYLVLSPTYSYSVNCFCYFPTLSLNYLLVLLPSGIRIWRWSSMIYHIVISIVSNSAITSSELLLHRWLVIGDKPKPVIMQLLFFLILFA